MGSFGLNSAVFSKKFIINYNTAVFHKEQIFEKRGKMQENHDYVMI